jgi:hypothetical protein
MRILKFIVKDLIIERDPSCNFEGLVPGSKEYLQAVFSFSPEWDGYVKVVSFRSVLGKEYPPQVLKNGVSCIIPSEALKRRIFKIQVLGKKGLSEITTNKISIEQNGGK